MNDLQIFNSPEFGEVRAVEIDGEPWFMAVDVCRALDIGNPTQALTRLDDDEVTLISNEGGREVNFVNEPGLYSLVLGSRKKKARAFKRWITHDVIPSIRKTGAYLTPELAAALADLPAMMELLAGLEERLSALEGGAAAPNRSPVFSPPRRLRIIPWAPPPGSAGCAPSARSWICFQTRSCLCTTTIFCTGST